MSISNREDANKYYQLINGLVDDYIDVHKIRPSKLSAYLKPGGQRFNKFLERNKLKDIKGAEIILKDVIEDREHMEKDGVITFESFKIMESSEFKYSELKECLYKGIDKSDLNMEKALADYFDINLGSIDVVDSDKHKFKIEDWENDDWVCVIYSDEECDVIKNNLVEYFYSDLIKKEFELVEGIKIELSDLVKSDVFEEKIFKTLNEEKFQKIISETLGEDWSFASKFRNYHIWIS
jgi:hypothetical protein